jgi:hypothetical protein
MRIFYSLILFTILTTLSAADTTISDVYSYPLEDGRTFHARHPRTEDPYFSYNDHTLTIRTSPSKTSSLWKPELKEDWLTRHGDQMILFFMLNSEGHQECIGFFWTQLGGPLTFAEVPDTIVRESFKRLIDLEF